MSLIKSISGIRGTIGGKAGEGFTPFDIVKFTAAYAFWLKSKTKIGKVVIGRDARMSGDMVKQLVCGTLLGCGFDVVDLDLCTTPTVEMAVTAENALGGIIITASHNPKNWNALKLLNEKGEFISATDGEEVLALAQNTEFSFAPVEQLGKIQIKSEYLDYHIEKILAHALVNREAISKANFSIVLDAVNSVGAIAVPRLLHELGVKKIINLFPEVNGNFPHNPEPLPENLLTLSNAVKNSNAHLGISVDPDVDRLAFVSDDGSMFGEEYTLVAVADYILKHKKGNTVSNLSSTKALQDITQKHGGVYTASAVGEVNVVAKMKEVQAVIGGEGNGGVIVPELHYGRDALIGIALFLSHLATCNMRASVLRASYPGYFVSKNKIELSPQLDIDKIIDQLQEKYKKFPQNAIDGLRIDFEQGWVHLRKSNTEPIVRIIAESNLETVANNIARQIMTDLNYFSR